LSVLREVANRYFLVGEEGPVQEIPIHVGVLAAVAVGKLILGAIWYSPIAFGPTWMKLTGCDPAATKKKIPASMVYELVGNFVIAFVLVHAVRYAGATSVGQGAAVGAFNGFALTAIPLVGATWFDRKRALSLLDASFQVVALVAMGAVLARFG
jgi:hypothetical protein